MQLSHLISNLLVLECASEGKAEVLFKYEQVGLKLGLDFGEGEAASLLQAIQWAHGLGLQQVIIELDAKVVVDNIHTNYCDLSEFGFIISECKHLLALKPTYEVVYVRRQVNVVVHSLARTTTFWSSPEVFDYLPSCISPFDAII